MRNRVAALAAVSAFAVGLTGIAVVAARSGGGSGLERLPSLAGGGREAADMAMAAGGGWSPYVEYVVEGTLPALPDEAPAFRLPADDDRDAIRRLAAGLGIKGLAVRQGSRYVVEDGGRRLTVEVAPGMPWYLGPGCPDAPVSSHGDEGVTAALCTVTSTAIAEPVPPDATADDLAKARERRALESGGGSSSSGSSGSASSSGSAVVSPDAGSSAASPPMPPHGKPEPFLEPRPVPPESMQPTPPADLPSREEADRIARGVFERLGVATDTFRLEGGVYSWEAFVSPPVGGLPVVGMEHIVSIGSKSAIQGGHGYLLVPKRIGDYPLAGVDAGLARLRAGSGMTATPMADDAVAAMEPYCPDTADCPGLPTGRPATVTITGVHLGLQHVADALVPVYVFETKDGGELAVPAVVDRWLEETHPTRGRDGGPEPDDGMSTGSCAAAVSGRGALVGGGDAAEEPNQPLVVEVCVEPAKAKVGQEVTFTVTVKDPDAEIYDEFCAGPEIDFGDQESVARTLCAHVCDADKARVTKTEPTAGELTRTFTHAYAKPGTYTARFAYRSEPCSKWSSTGETNTTVVVVG